MSHKIKPHKRKSIIKQTLENKICIDDINDRMSFNFSQMDYNQSASFDDWENIRVLSKAMDTIKSFCHEPIPKTDNDTFAIYGDFPPVSDFSHPKHVPEDATWARIHVDGTRILAGHIDTINQIFYVVFLDTHHGFWKTELKGT